MAGATEALGPDRAGIAAVANNTARQIGGATGVALIGSFALVSTALAARGSGGYGAYYEGMCVLSGGAVSRLSPQPQAAPGQTSLDAPAVLTANGQVIFQRTGVT